MVWYCIASCKVSSRPVFSCVQCPAGGSGIFAFILVLLLQGWYVLKIPSQLKHDSKKKEESRKTIRKKEKIGERKKVLEGNWRRLKKFRENWRK